MTKKELFKRFWIPIKKKVPPEDNSIFVLVWNYSWEQPMVQPAHLAHYTALAILNEERKVDISGDRLFSHWMEVHKP